MNEINSTQPAESTSHGITAAGVAIALKKEFGIETNTPTTARDKLKAGLNRLYDVLSKANPKVKEALKSKSISQKELVARLDALGVPVNNLTDSEIIKAALQAAGFSADEIAKINTPVLDPFPTDEPSKDAKPKAPKQPATPAEPKPAAIKPAAVIRPQGLDENGYQAWQAVVKISGRSDSKELETFRKAWSNDGKISLDEARELGINGKDDQLFIAADNKMRVTHTGYVGKGENDHYLDLAELQEVVKVALEYAKMAGQVDPSTTFEMYRTMYLMDVDFDGIRTKLDAICKDGGAGFQGLDLAKLTDKAYLETQFKALKSSLSSELFDLLIARVQKGEIKNYKDVGIYVFSCAMASMTSNYDGFKVGELKDKVENDKIGRYQPRRPETSADDFGSWTKEGKVGGEENKGEKGDDFGKKIRDAKSKEDYIKIYEGLNDSQKSNPQYVEEVYNGLHAYPEEQAKVIEKLPSTRKDGKLGEIIKKYAEKRDYENAEKYLRQISGSKEKQEVVRSTELLAHFKKVDPKKAIDLCLTLNEEEGRILILPEPNSGIKGVIDGQEDGSKKIELFKYLEGKSFADKKPALGKKELLELARLHLINGGVQDKPLLAIKYYLSAIKLKGDDFDLDLYRATIDILQKGIGAASSDEEKTALADLKTLFGSEKWKQGIGKTFEPPVGEDQKKVAAKFKKQLKARKERGEFSSYEAVMKRINGLSGAKAGGPLHAAKGNHRKMVDKPAMPNPNPAAPVKPEKTAKKAPPKKGEPAPPV